MSAKPPQRKGHGKADRPEHPSPPSDDDLAALDVFCKQAQLDEISFEDWREFHADLDLTIPLFTAALEAETGCQKELRYSRTIRTGRDVPKREPTVILVTVPPGTVDGQLLLIQAQGDRRDSMVGDLRIRIRIKR